MCLLLSRHALSCPQIPKLWNIPAGQGHEIETHVASCRTKHVGLVGNYWSLFGGHWGSVGHIGVFGVGGVYFTGASYQPHERLPNRHTLCDDARSNVNAPNNFAEGFRNGVPGRSLLEPSRRNQCPKAGCDLEHHSARVPHPFIFVWREIQLLCPISDSTTAVLRLYGALLKPGSRTLVSTVLPRRS